MFIDKLISCTQWKHHHILNFIYDKYLTDESIIGHLTDGSSYLLEPLKIYSKGSVLELALICRQPSEQIVWLIDQGCDVNQTSEKFVTPLMSVAAQGRLDIVKLFIEKDAQINAQNELGASALVSAVAGKRWDVMHFLVEHGASIDTQDQNGYTSLIMAVLGRNFDGSIKYGHCL